MMWRQHAIKKGCLYIKLSKMVTFGKSQSKDEPDGSGVGNGGVSKIIVPAKLLPVPANDKSSFVTQDAAMAITFDFEDPFGGYQFGTTTHGGSDEKAPDTTATNGRKFFLDRSFPVSAVR